MSIEYLGEKIFLEEIEANGAVWVAKNSYHSVYSQEIDHAGFSLPVWSNYQRVVDFLANARLIGPKYEPHAIPLKEFTNAWLSDQMKAIAELQINPDGKTSRVLVLTSDEFQTSQATK